MALLKPFGNLLSPKRVVPTGRLKIDWSHPLAQGLSVLYLPSVSGGINVAKSGLGDLSPVMNTNQKYSITQEGPGWITTTGADGLKGVCPSELLTASAWTFYWRGFFSGGGTSTGNNFIGIQYSDPEVSPYYFASVSIPNGQSLQNRCLWNSAGSYQGAAPSVSLTNNTLCSCGGTFIVGGLVTPYANGTAGSTASFGSAPTYAASASINLQTNTSSTARPISAAGTIAGIWTRALSAAEMAWLDQDPYCFLLPEEGEMPALYLASAGGGAVWSFGGISRGSISSAPISAGPQTGGASVASGAGSCTITASASAIAAEFAVSVASAIITTTCAASGNASTAGQSAATVSITTSAASVGAENAAAQASAAITTSAAAPGIATAPAAASSVIVTSASASGLAAGIANASATVTTTASGIAAGLAAAAASANISAFAIASGVSTSNAGVAFVAIATDATAAGSSLVTVPTVQELVGSPVGGVPAGHSLYVTQPGEKKKKKRKPRLISVSAQEPEAQKPDTPSAAQTFYAELTAPETAQFKIEVLRPELGTEVPKPASEESVYSNDITVILRSLPQEAANDDAEAMSLILALAA